MCWYVLYTRAPCLIRTVLAQWTADARNVTAGYPGWTRYWVDVVLVIVCLSVCVLITVLRHVCREWALLSFHFVCLDVCRSLHDLQPTTIDRSQPNLVDRYIPVPYLPYFGCQREKYAKFRLFPTRRQWVTPNPTCPTIRHTHRLTSAFFDLCPYVQMAAL